MARSKVAMQVYDPPYDDRCVDHCHNEGKVKDLLLTLHKPEARAKEFEWILVDSSQA